MTPRPEEVKEPASGRRGGEEPLAGHEVVISGISGKFPESDSVRDFMRNLYDKVDMVSDDNRRWNVDHPDIPNSIGTINGVGKFDAQFFGVHYKQAMSMDPMGQMLLENAYGAIIDAGINPRDMRNSKTGVFVGMAISDAEKTWFIQKDQISGFGLTGSARAMLANRISYWLGAQGPSYTLQAECSSSLVGLEHAYNAIRSGQCDAAIVANGNLCMHPFISLQYCRNGFLSENGRTRCFDKNATGFGRAEAISVILLQRAKDAKRAYAQVIHAKTICNGFHSDGMPYANKIIQRAFLEDFYSEVNVLPKQVQYIEAFGAGIPEVDKNELETIDEVFCKDRQEPILVGSVKSNMGHAGAASGAASVTKICLAYHKGEIAPNLHYQKPRSDVAGVREGRIRIVTEPTPFSGGYTAASSYSFSGVNVHVLFKGIPKRRIRTSHNLPCLVTLSGRSEESLKTMLKELESLPLNMEQIHLLHNIHEVPIPGHVFRAYNVLDLKEGETVSATQNVDYFPGLKRPVWFVYSGMGSQWSGMGAHLMRIPVFAAAIERCRQVLAPKGVDLMHILTDPDPTIYDNILHSFVGIAAVQIGLTDVLTALGIKPDNIIGHSVGELGCGYADGCLTAEEMILSAYSRGLVSTQIPFIRGSMAAVGIGYDQIKSLCPPEIEVACHNGPDSCTISGPADAMKSFVGELTSRGIFAKEVPCSNIAYHSRYIAKAGPALLKYLQEVIKEPKPRSSRWLSTSVPQTQWDQPSARLCSAEYHTNNLLKPVLFEETSRQIPPNAITIEVAPHGLLQAILRRSLAADCIHVPLTKRQHPDNVQFLLDAVGKLYLSGLEPKIANIYPTVQFPVSVETPVMSHLVGWEHSEDWFSKLYFPQIQIKTGERQVAITTHDEEYKFMNGHVIDGVNTFPAAGYLLLAWETLAMTLGTHYSKLSVVFEDVRFESYAVLRAHDTLDLVIMLQKATGKFEITSRGGIMASGRIYSVISSSQQHAELMETKDENDATSVMLSAEDVYNILLCRGYSYTDQFRSIETSNISASKGQIKFNDNWVTFLDGILQMNILRRQSRGISKPKLIQKLSINIKQHMSVVSSKTRNMDVTIQDLYNFTRCGGVKMEGLVLTERARRIQEPPLLETYTFVPYFPTQPIQEKDSLSILLQVATQNTTTDTFKVVIVTDEASKQDQFSRDVQDILEGYQKINHELKIVTEVNKHLDIFLKTTKEIIKCNIVIFSNLLNRRKVMEELCSSLDDESWVLTREHLAPNVQLACEKLEVISDIKSSGSRLVLLKKRAAVSCSRGTKYITVQSSSKMAWLQLLQAEWRTCDRLVLVSECDPSAGLLGLFKCLRREPGGHALSLLLIDDYSAPAFRPDLPFYREQLAKNLDVNVFQNGEWGSYQYLPLPPVSVQREHVYLASQRPEDISSLAWLEGPLTLDSAPSHPMKKLIQVYYSSVSHMDMRKASGRLQFENSKQQDRSNGYSMDFCGRTSTGERVMGLVQSGALSSLVVADVDMLWPVPPHWSMEDAATVPLAYANAFYCLDLQGGIEPGMSVLIHSGCGALGQAAISICLALGCEVFTTVSTLYKKRWLLRMFPGLKENNIGNSRCGDFEDMVMSATEEGCNVILNTLSGDLRTISMRCLSPMGTFVSVNGDDCSTNSAFGMSFLCLNRTFKSAFIADIFRQSESSRRIKIQQLIADGIARGYVRPLSRVVLDASEAPRAFRFTSTGRHVGKVLLKLRDEELRPLISPSRALLAAQPQFLCSGDGNYIIILGSEHSGLELADWLVQRGARSLVLHSPRLASDSGYYAFRVRCWHRRGVNIQHSADNLQTEIGCMQLLKDAAKQSPVLGIFMTPRDSHHGMFEHINYDRFTEDFVEKAHVIVNLDNVTRKLCPLLQQFVVWTSAAAGRGAAGCSSGSLADSVVERVCEERGKLGLPALAVQHPAESLSIAAGLDQLLASKHNVVSVSARPLGETETLRNELSSTIFEIFGYSNCKLDDTRSLQYYNMDLSTAKEISSILENKYQIFVTPDKAMKLSISELSHIQFEKTTQLKEISQGLDCFFNFVDPEEFNAGEPLIRMPTLLTGEFVAEEETYKRDTYLILIPGMEGHKNIFSTITKRLKLNAFTHQLDFDNFEDSIQDMATRMSQVILKKLRPEGKFLLLGYSFGVTVALEVAAKLEEDGHVGQVFCLDGSPRWFTALLDAHLGHLSEQDLQNAVIAHMFRVMLSSGGGDTSIEEEALQLLQSSLAAERDWERKLDACMRHLRGRVKFSFQYQRSLLAMAYARIQQARSYSDAALLSRPLRSELVLLKAMRRPPSLSAAAEALGRDLGLGAYSQRPVAIHELDCDHAAAPFDLSISNIINARVADLQHYKNFNLCESYDMIMS